MRTARSRRTGIGGLLSSSSERLIDGWTPD